MTFLSQRWFRWASARVARLAWCFGGFPSKSWYRAWTIQLRSNNCKQHPDSRRFNPFLSFHVITQDAETHPLHWGWNWAPGVLNILRPCLVGADGTWISRFLCCEGGLIAHWTTVVGVISFPTYRGSNRVVIPPNNPNEPPGLFHPSPSFLLVQGIMRPCSCSFPAISGRHGEGGVWHVDGGLWLWSLTFLDLRWSQILLEQLPVKNRTMRFQHETLKWTHTCSPRLG